MRNCVLYANVTEPSTGPNSYCVDLDARNCYFARNQASSYGGAFVQDQRSCGTPVPAVFESCIFSGNRSAVDGGAVCFYGVSGSSVVVRNCIFAGNKSANAFGNDLYIAETKPGLENNLFASGAGFAGSSVWFRRPQQDATFYGNVFYGSETAIYEAGEYDVEIRNNDFFGIVRDIVNRSGGGLGTDIPFIELFLAKFRQNIDLNPRWVGRSVAQGKWTAPPVWDPETGLTTLFDASARWTPRQFDGCLLDVYPVDPDAPAYALIVTNDQSSLTVRGNWSPIVKVADFYKIDDWHLTAGSPLIDAGKIGAGGNNDYEGDPRPWNDIPDIGPDEYILGAGCRAPVDLACTADPCFVVRLRWTNRGPYDRIVVSRDGASVATLSGAAESYEETLRAPGRHTYEVAAACEDQTFRVSCEVQIVIPAPENLRCTASGLVVALDWLNPCDYDSVEVWRGTSRIGTASGAKGPATYRDETASPGQHTYRLVPKVAGTSGPEASCSALVRPPAPSNLSCWADGTRCELRWTNPPSPLYDAVRVVVDGAEPGQSLPGTAQSYSTRLMPGPHTFEVYGVSNGVPSERARCDVIVPPPMRPTLQSCTANEYAVALTWTRPAGAEYDEFRLYRNGVRIAILPASASSTTDTVPGPGVYTYELQGVLGGVGSDRDSCQVTIRYLAPPTGLTCAARGFQVSLSWTNGPVPYDSIAVYRNGSLLQTLAGTARNYLDTVGAPGTYAYSLRAVKTVGDLVCEAQCGPCEASIVLPIPPEIVGCALVGWDVELTWVNKNPEPCDQIEVTRDGTKIATLPGTATRYLDRNPPQGTRHYGLIGRLGGAPSSEATCDVEVPPPPRAPSFDSCVAEKYRVTLSWSRPPGERYDELHLYRDSTRIAILPGTDLSASDTVPGPGMYRYELQGVRAGVGGDRSACDVKVDYLPAPFGLGCSSRGFEVYLNWDNGNVHYDGLFVYRDGVQVAALRGTARSYVDSVPDVGDYSYYVVGRVQIGDLVCEAPSEVCEASVRHLQPPEIVECRLLGRDVEITWVHPGPATPDQVEITRDGVKIATVPGTATQYVDRSPPGSRWRYGLIARRGGAGSDEATCEVSLPAGPKFRRADSNADGRVDLSDAIFTLNYLFLGGEDPSCLDAADSDDSGSVDITDAIATLNYLFLGGAEPPDPGPRQCGLDPTEDALPCVEQPGCG